jgi:hypothetical protein
VSCNDGIVEFTYPLKNDDEVKKAFQSDIYLPLRDLANFGQLKLPKNQNHENFVHGHNYAKTA